MAPALIIPASILGFISALVRYLAFHATFVDAAITYFMVGAAVSVILVWGVKTAELLHHSKTDLALPAR